MPPKWDTLKTANKTEIYTKHVWYTFVWLETTLKTSNIYKLSWGKILIILTNTEKHESFTRQKNSSRHIVLFINPFVSQLHALHLYLFLATKYCVYIYIYTHLYFPLSKTVHYQPTNICVTNFYSSAIQEIKEMNASGTVLKTSL